MSKQTMEECCKSKGNAVRNDIRTKMFNWVDEYNPISEQVKDTKLIQDFFAAYPVVPFSGTTQNSGHELLSFFQKMKALSPTHAACIESIKLIGFSGKIGIEYAYDEDFDTQKKEYAVTDTQKKEYVDYVKAATTDISIKELAKQLFDDKKTVGNAYFEIVKIKALGQTKVQIKYHEPSSVLYAKTDANADKFFFISKVWTLDYLGKNKPRAVAKFPNFTETSKGVESSIVHIKNGNFEWYGRPDSMSAVIYQYREFQDATYMARQSSKNFTGQVLLEVEGEDPSLDDSTNFNDTGDADGGNDMANQANRIAQNFTNEGSNAQTVLYMERPYGAKSAFVHQFTPNTNENFYAVMSDIATDNIVMSHNWSKRLLGISEANGFSSNIFIDELKTKMPMIVEVQHQIEKALNEAIWELMRFSGRLDLIDFGLKFNSPFKSILEATANATTNMDTNAANTEMI